MATIVAVKSFIEQVPGAVLTSVASPNATMTVSKTINHNSFNFVHFADEQF
jgi:hypothetical protein